MNFEDQEKPTPPKMEPWIEPELEARVVAWVAGEASSFEAAELERLCAEKPELAIFKRRIEAVHGLVGEAAQPDKSPLRMADERREKLLATLRAADAGGPAVENAGNVVPLPQRIAALPRVPSRWTWRGPRPYYAIAGIAAAALAVMLFAPRPKKPAYVATAQVHLERPETMVATQGVVDQAIRSAADGRVSGISYADSPGKPVVNNARQLSAPADQQYLEARDKAESKVSMRRVVEDAQKQREFELVAGEQNAPALASMPAPVLDPAGQDSSVAARPPLPDFNQRLTLNTSGTLDGSGVVALNGGNTFNYVGGSASAPAATTSGNLTLGVTAGYAGGGAAGSSLADRDVSRAGKIALDSNSLSDGRELQWGTRAGPTGSIMLQASGAATPGLATTSNGGTLAVVGGSIGSPAGSTPLATDAEIVKMDAFQVSAPGGSYGAMATSGSAAARVNSLLPPPPGFIVDGMAAARPAPSQTVLGPAPGGGGIAPVFAPVAVDVNAPAATTMDAGSAAPATVGQSFVVAGMGGASSSPARSDTPAAAPSAPSSAANEVVQLSAFTVTSSKDAKTKAQAAAKTAALDERLKAESAARRESDENAKTGGAAGQKTDDDSARRPAAPPDTPSVEETSTSKESISTFSLHVSDASFRLAQTALAALARGENPSTPTIRPEEFYNAFDYGDPAPARGEKISCRIEQGGHPFLPQRNFVRIAMKVGSSGRGPVPLRLTILLDTSGSMEREDRAATVRRALQVLVSLLGPNDRVTLIGFARTPRLLAENVAGNAAASLLDVIARTPAEGGTNLEEALKLATQLARRHRDAAAQNRIVLLTDGAANLGDADPARLATLVTALREQRIAFDACGVGRDGIDDQILERLTRQGDGRYCVLDSPEAADAGFAQKLAGAFRPAAENVKVQVRFNPARVASYRLIGFEQHRLRTEDFRNDKVDAAELAADEAAVALYQVEPIAQGEGELGDVYVRFRDPATAAMVEQSWTMSYDAHTPAFARAPAGVRLAGTAALLAEKFRESPLADQFKLGDLAGVVSSLRTDYAKQPRVQELVTMFAEMRRLSGE